MDQIWMGLPLAFFVVWNVPLQKNGFSVFTHGYEATLPELVNFRFWLVYWLSFQERGAANGPENFDGYTPGNTKVKVDSELFVIM